MGKTYRRKDIESKGEYWNYSSGRGEVDQETADNMFHSDKPKRWSGLESEVKERQNEIARMEKRKIKNRVLSGAEPMYDKTDKTVRQKANKCYQYS